MIACGAFDNAEARQRHGENTGGRNELCGLKNESNLRAFSAWLVLTLNCAAEIRWHLALFGVFFFLSFFSRAV